MSQITCQCKEKTLGHSIKHPSKSNRNTDVVALHRELHLNLNRDIRHGRALKNVGLWSRAHKIPRGVRQKVEYPEKGVRKRWNILSPLKNGYIIRVLNMPGFEYQPQLRSF